MANSIYLGLIYKQTNMKRSFILITFFILFFSNVSHTQQLGASFSYFFPKNGYFSIPVAPVSFKDLGFKIGDYFGITTGITLYRFSGMGVKQLPFESKLPLMGPLFATMIPLSFKIIIPTSILKVELIGGGFGYYPFGSHLIYGNLNKEIAAYEGWYIVSSDLQFDNKFGYGYNYGGKITYFINKKIGAVLGAFYYNGSSPVNIRGDIYGGDLNNIIQTKSVEYPSSKLDFSGWEISLGVDYKVR